MIIGIAFVIEELHKGPRMVFRYPSSVPSNILNNNEDLQQFHQEYLSISPENFAKLFRPKSSLFNKVSELIIHNLVFISFPCSIENSLDVTSRSSSPISFCNVIITIVRDNIMKKIEGDVDSFQVMDPIAIILGLGYKKVHVESVRRVIEAYTHSLINEEKKCQYISKQVASIISISDLYVTSSGQTIPAPGIASHSIRKEDAISNDRAGLDLEFELMLAENLLEQVPLVNELRRIYHGLVGGHSVNLKVNDNVSVFVKLCSQSVHTSHSKHDFSELAVLLVAEVDTIVSVITQQELPTCKEIEMRYGSSGGFNPCILRFLNACSPFLSIQDLSTTLNEPLHEVLSIAKYLEKLGLASYITPIHQKSIFFVSRTVPTNISNRVYKSFATTFGHEVPVTEVKELDIPIMRDTPIQILLFQILASFNGIAVVDVIKTFPKHLQPFGVDIIVWLLRWNLIESKYS